MNSSDFSILAANYGKTGMLWPQGDFNGDGTVNALDFNALASHYGLQLASADVPDDGAIINDGSVAGNGDQSLSGGGIPYGSSILTPDGQLSGELPGIGGIVPEPASGSIVLLAGAMMQ